MSDLLQAMPAWVEHQDRVRDAEAERDRLWSLAEQVRDEHRAALTTWQEDFEKALAEGNVPPPKPSEPVPEVAQAAAVQRTLADNLKRSEGPRLLGSLLAEVEASVRDRSRGRDEAAQELLAELDRLRVEQQEDQSTLKRTRVAFHRDNPPRPHPAEQTPVPMTVADYVAQVAAGADWLAATPVASPQGKIQKVDDEPWQATTAQRKLAGAEFARLRSQPTDHVRQWL